MAVANPCGVHKHVPPMRPGQRARPSLSGFIGWRTHYASASAVFPSCGLDADHPLVVKGQQVLARALTRPADVVIWNFATDGGHLMQAGVPAIGFGPAEAHKLHTVGESVPLDMLSEGLLGYTALALELGEAPACTELRRPVLQA